MDEGKMTGVRPTSMPLPPEARCPLHGTPLLSAGDLRADQETEVHGACGCTFPVRKGIPRFVLGAQYVDAFGIQWNAFRKTQLDSYTATTISRDRLTRCLGGSLDDLRGASVLEVGCGAGRFTEILLSAGARVFACDLSDAVEANYANSVRESEYFVCQADVVSLPVAPAAFDIVIALGMIQHTPSPEATIAALSDAVRPGGLLVVDHYLTPSPLVRLVYPFTLRAILRQILIRVPPRDAFRATGAIVRALLPIHRLFWRRGFVVKRVRAVWRLMSPVFDYYDSHPELGKYLGEWARLDTHDALTDRYKHVRTPQQITNALHAAGLDVIDSRPAGNGVEARARRPSGSALGGEAAGRGGPVSS